METEISKTKKGIIAAFATSIVILVLASSLLASAQVNSSTENNNYNANMGQTIYNAQYSSTSNSAYATTAAKYGDPLNPDYGYGNPCFGGAARIGFNPGPAPDRADVLWTSGDVLNTYSKIPASYAKVDNWGGTPIGIDGQLIGSGDIRLPNNTVLSGCMISLNPITGALNWYTPFPTGTSFGNTFFGFANTWKVDDKHFINGYTMWKTDGTFLWSDPTMVQGMGDVYHTMIVAAAPSYKLFTTAGTAAGQRVPETACFNLSSPETKMAAGARWLWNYTVDEPGDVGLAYDIDHDLLFRGGYSNYGVFALSGTTGLKVWETFLPTAIGYAGCYANGRLYIGCQSVDEFCLNATTGKIIWQNKDGMANRAFNVWNINYAYDRVYYHDLGSGRTGAQKCYDALTGQKLWASTELHSIGYYTTVVADGKIYGEQADASTTTGRLADPAAFYCWDAFTGEVIWKLHMTISDPIVAYGNLYFVVGGFSFFGSTPGTLYCISTAHPAASWIEWRGNTQYPGITLNDGPSDFSSGPVWTYQTGAGIQGSPVVANGKLYVASGDRNIYCLDAYNGTEIWKFRTAEPRMTHWGSTMAVYSGVVVVGPDDGHIYGLDANTGTVKYTIDAGPFINFKVNLGQHEIRSSPIIYNSYAYVGSCHNNKTYCFDPVTGSVKWTLDLGAPIVGSAAFNNGIMYIITYGSSFDADAAHTERMYEINASPDPSTGGRIVLNFSISTSGAGFFSFGASSYTPDVSLDGKIVYFGATGNYLRGYNTTTGASVLQAAQPHVLSENAHGSLVLLPGTMLNPVNSLLLNPRDTINGGVYTPFNGTQYTFSDTSSNYAIGQAGPTVFCAILNNLTVSGGGLDFFSGIYTTPWSAQVATTGDNIWSDWGGWEVWSSPITASWGANMKVYYGSESYAIHCINASNGIPLTWWTTGGPMGASPAVYDGKLYCASADGQVYCFEQHLTTQTTTTASVDNTSPSSGQAVNVTVKVASVPSINVYQEIGQAAPIPSIPNQALIVTFIKPDGTTTVDVPATTDTYGNAVVTYTPDVGGNWQVVAAYKGIMGPVETYAKSSSDVIPITVGGSTATSSPTTIPTVAPTSQVTSTPVVTPEVTATPITGTNNNLIIYAGIAVIVIVVIIIAALMLLRRKK
jgi:outer membrane protein assembly factor BamB